MLTICYTRNIISINRLNNSYVENHSIHSINEKDVITNQVKWGIIIINNDAYKHLCKCCLPILISNIHSKY